MLHETELSPRRQRSRERRTERIVATAGRLLAEEGFDALTMGRLAEELDVSVGSLYRYFRSKDALVAELQRRAVAQIQTELDEARARWRERLPEGAGAAAVADLLAMGRLYLELPARAPARYRLVNATLADPRTLVDDTEAAQVTPLLATLLQRVADAFAAAAAAGHLAEGDAWQRTLVYWAGLHGTGLFGKLERLLPEPAAALTAKRLGLELATALFRGWGASPEDVARAAAWLHSSMASEPLATHQPETRS
ncbi:MAG: helix-turn-helix domain-containing protein [Polyangiaceae bacterium]